MKMISCSVKKIENLSEKLSIIFRFLKARRRVPKLYAQADEASRALLGVLNSTLRFNVTEEERFWIDKIEYLRKELNSSTQLIRRVLFGLPPEYPNPPGKQMENGRLVIETVGQACRRASRQRLWCLLLFKLIREFRPSVCLEMGTSLGITALYQAAALALNQHGKLITMEGDETISSIAKRNSQLLGLDTVLSIVTGRFQDTLNSVLNEHGPVDYVFVDADKDEKAVLGYFEQIYTFMSSKSVLVLDDIYWSSGMEKAWKAIEDDERVQISADLRALGVCIVDRDLNRKERFIIQIG